MKKIFYTVFLIALLLIGSVYAYGYMFKIIGANIRSKAGPIPGSVFISYVDNTTHSLKFARSPDIGITWTTSTVDSSVTVYSYTSIGTVDGKNIYISYTNNTNYDLRFARSTDSGLTWTTSIIDNTVSAGGFNSIAVVSNKIIYISYYDDTNNNLKIAKTIDGGTTWVLKTIATDLSNTDWTCAISAVDANTVYTTYSAVGASPWIVHHINVVKTTDGGATWILQNVTPSTGLPRNQQYVQPSIYALSVNTIYIAYMYSQGADLDLSKSTDGGVTWTQQVIDNTVSTGLGQGSSITANGSNVYITYFDNTNYNIKLARSSNNGTSWNLSVVNYVNSAGVRSSVSADGAKHVYVSTYDSTNPGRKLYFGISYNSGASFTNKIIDSVGNVGDYNSITNVYNPR